MATSRKFSSRINSMSWRCIPIGLDDVAAIGVGLIVRRVGIGSIFSITQVKANAGVASSASTAVIREFN